MAKIRKLTKQSLIQLLVRNDYTLIELCKIYDASPLLILNFLNELRDDKYRLKMPENSNIEFGPMRIETLPDDKLVHEFDPNIWKGDIIKFGFVSDNHLCNINSREDVLNLLYDIFEDEGVSVVYQGGNWVDGEFKWNKNELIRHGCSAQVAYAAKNWPHRKGIVTKFVVADDHEGWWTQREGIDVGKLFVSERKNLMGLEDLEYLGYAEADVLISPPDAKFKSYMRVVHLGGGAPYAISYPMQKLVESYQGGEKPAVVLGGHHHKFDYSYPREVHSVLMGTTCDQTLFMRKKKIQAMVGGGIITIRMSPYGTITRFSTEWIPFYDKKFYIGKDKYFRY